MPTILSDPPFALYVLLLAGVIVGFGVWFNKRNRASLIVFGSFLTALLVLFLLDRLFESPREESKRRIEEMAKAIDAQNKEAFLSHFADSFQYQGEDQTITISRETLRQSQLWSRLNQYKVHVGVWDFTR
ncbi:MAG TPA: hypothetical protein VG097_14490, partial [Gemmata sp.]|nr:hypothetical protein [Gemmata sp.]